jgi:hypothetical protein
MSNGSMICDSFIRKGVEWSGSGLLQNTILGYLKNDEKRSQNKLRAEIWMLGIMGRKQETTSPCRSTGSFPVFCQFIQS